MSALGVLQGIQDWDNHQAQQTSTVLQQLQIMKAQAERNEQLALAQAAQRIQLETGQTSGGPQKKNFLSEHVEALSRQADPVEQQAENARRMLEQFGPVMRQYGDIDGLNGLESNYTALKEKAAEAKLRRVEVNERVHASVGAVLGPVVDQDTETRALQDWNPDLGTPEEWGLTRDFNKDKGQIDYLTKRSLTFKQQAGETRQDMRWRDHLEEEARADELRQQKEDAHELQTQFEESRQRQEQASKLQGRPIPLVSSREAKAYIQDSYPNLQDDTKADSAALYLKRLTDKAMAQDEELSGVAAKKQALKEMESEGILAHQDDRKDVYTPKGTQGVRYHKGQIVTVAGKRYRVLEDDMSGNPDIEEVK